MFLNRCSTTTFMICSCLSALVQGESRNPQPGERDRNHFWHFLPFLNSSVGKTKTKKKPQQIDTRVNSTFAARIQNLYLSPELDSTGSIMKREASSVQAF